MSEDFLKDPLSLFSVKGKTAIITGATGAFGVIAAKTLAAVGANVVLFANGPEALQKVAGSLSVPFLVIGDANVRGFDEGSWNAALDRAGYARTRLPGQAGPRADTATK